MKRLTILAIAILSASTAFAERGSFRDRSENWLQNTSSETSGSLRGAPVIDGDSPTTTPTTPNDPIGDLAFGLILSLGLIYSSYTVLQRKQSDKPC
ncbi:hypothetical protein FACS189413_03050 [Bacteroidia bacterium]|nr:hypothetical protein FACS189413_03050 [Bacteroidia bacterium]